MTASDVNLLHNLCVDNQGTVKAWPDSLGGIVGQIQIVRPQSFCSPCLEFEPAPHVNIEAIVSAELYKRILRHFFYTYTQT